MRRLSLILAATLSLTPAAAHASEPAEAEPAARAVTLEEAVALAVQQHQRVVASGYAIEQAESERKQTRGNLLPKLRVEAGVQFWDSALTASLGDFGDLPIEVPAFEVRKAITWDLMIAVVQPLTAFWTLWEAHEVGKLGVDVKRLERETAEQERAKVVAESYLRVLQAREMAGITAQSLAQRQGQVERAAALVDMGVIRKDDLLRARLGEADARQRMARSERQVRLAEAHLTMAVGVREGQAGIDAKALEGPLAGDLMAPPALPTVAAAQAEAMKSRTEVTTVERQVAQARGAVQISRSKLLPEVSAIAAFTTSGGSELQSGEQFFVGLNLTWNVWEWGAVWYGLDAAAATVRQAEAGLSELREGIRLQVRAAHESARTARELTVLAADAVAIAEENFRLVQARYEERAATSFDVLDAETQLTSARAQLASARYEFLVARAGLHRAMGYGPRAIARGGVSR